MKQLEILMCTFVLIVLSHLLADRTRLVFNTMSTSDYERVKRKVIHVTGFGPFRGFTEKNPSWEAVSRLPDAIEHSNEILIIEKHNVAVTYEAVNEIVPKLWQTKPLVSVCRRQHYNRRLSVFNYRK